MPKSNGRPLNRRASTARMYLNTKDAPGVFVTTYPWRRNFKTKEFELVPHITTIATTETRTLRTLHRGNQFHA